uniref:Uncharacterized protein n=1 Tax=Aegilops tauschii TaxID=37682 RepID=M8BJZ8_AEGTA
MSGVAIRMLGRAELQAQRCGALSSLAAGMGMEAAAKHSVVHGEREARGELHNSQEVPAKKPHGDRASTSTLSTASKTKAKAKKAAGTEENTKKKMPRLEPADEDPLQDTACSPANASYATRQLHLQDGWQIAGCECEQRSSSAAPAARQWVEYCRRRQWDSSREGPDAEIKEVLA